MWRIAVTHPASQEKKAALFDGPKITIGRNEDNDIVLPEHHVSREHAQLINENNRSIIEVYGL